MRARHISAVQRLLLSDLYFVGVDAQRWVLVIRAAFLVGCACRASLTDIRVLNDYDFVS